MQDVPLGECVPHDHDVMVELANLASCSVSADLNTIGGLPTLLDLLAGPHPSLRWRTAEVVATCVANNEPVQQVSNQVSFRQDQL